MFTNTFLLLNRLITVASGPYKMTIYRAGTWERWEACKVAAGDRNAIGSNVDAFGIVGAVECSTVDTLVHSLIELVWAKETVLGIATELWVVVAPVAPLQ